MDKVTDSDSVDAGSIPVRSANNKNSWRDNMDNKQSSTLDYAKLFLLMIIPVYGFCFTALLAFSKDVTGELKYLARGAFVARMVFLTFVGIIAIIFFSTALPYIKDFINNIEALGVLR